MSKFKKIIDIVIDVETVGIFSPQKTRGENGMLISNAIFNVGVTVQHKGNVISSTQYGIEDIWKFPEHRILDFYRKNFAKDGSEFEEMFPDFETYWEQAFVPLLKKIKKDGHQARIWSYNAEFDRRAFIDNLKLYDLKMPDLIYDNWNCIMVLVGNVMNNNPKKKRKYYNFLLEQEYLHKDCSFITKAGNYKTSAESIYRFISSNPDLIEAHKGKQDTAIEGEILKWCKKERGWSKLNSKPQGGGWQIVNDTAKPFQCLSSVLADGHYEDGNFVYPNYLEIKNIEAFDYVLKRAEKHVEDKRG